MKAIDLRITKERYTEFRFHANLKGREMPTLEEILGVESSDTESSKTEVDKDVAARLEAHALKKLKEQQAR